MKYPKVPNSIGANNALLICSGYTYYWSNDKEKGFSILWVLVYLCNFKLIISFMRWDWCAAGAILELVELLQTPQKWLEDNDLNTQFQPPPMSIDQQTMLT